MDRKEDAVISSQFPIVLKLLWQISHSEMFGSEYTFQLLSNFVPREFKKYEQVD